MQSIQAGRRFGCTLSLVTAALLAVSGCGQSSDCAAGDCVSAAGASGSAGESGSGANHCSASFSGGLSGTVACSVTLTYDAGTDQTTLTISGGEVAGDQWSSFSFTFPGQPRSDSIQASDMTRIVNVVTSSTGERWLTDVDKTTTIGSAGIMLTALGVPSTSADGSTQYLAPHGSAYATLLDQNPSTMRPDLMQTITF